jgi:hypothetical protein
VKLENIMNTGQIAFDCPVCSGEKGLIDGDGKGNLEINYNRICLNVGLFDTNYMHGPVIKLLKNMVHLKTLETTC